VVLWLKRVCPQQPPSIIATTARKILIRLRTSDEDRARREAAARLQASVATPLNASIRVDGWVGDADPICAIQTPLSSSTDELLISTPPEHRSNWLAEDLVNRALERVELPASGFVVEDAATRSALLVIAC
jgi:hypothetical protein